MEGRCVRILVTGGMGFIGSAFLKLLNRQGGCRIVVCDHLTASDKWRNLLGAVVDDVVDVGDLEGVLSGSRFDAIVHLGARSDTREHDLHTLASLNFTPSKILFRAAVQQSARFVYASSAATYGDGSNGWSDRTSPRMLKPLNAYGFYKNLFDWWVAQQTEFPPVCIGLKFFNVYGPGEGHKGPMGSAVLHFYQQLARGEAVQLFRSLRADIPDGMQRRDFVWVGDAVETIWRVLEEPPFPRGLLNVGTGTASTFMDVVAALGAALGDTVAVEFVDMPEAIANGYQYFSQADTHLLAQLGLTFSSLDQGVDYYVQALRGGGL